MEKKVRVLIVEDEFITLDMLRDYLEQSGYEVSGDAMRADEAIEVLERFDTDIALLDINIKGDKDGIWLAHHIRQHYQIPFIFLTAYSDQETVKRAADINPYGYLVKPFSQADIFTTIEVALKNYAKETYPLQLPEQNWTEGGELLINQSIFIKDQLSYKKIDIADIRYIQAYKNYLEIHLSNQRVVIRATLQRFTGVLPHQYFVQVHRSFVVNVQYVEVINPDNVVIEGQKVPLSKQNKDEFIKKFNFFV
ncbi:MAG: response regulator [Saprospiraceae bacterium]|nr:response regulator [Saprospiraceae bacterium]